MRPHRGGPSKSTRRSRDGITLERSQGSLGHLESVLQRFFFTFTRCSITVRKKDSILSTACLLLPSFFLAADVLSSP
ncbi:hypothetical protein B296_00028548 [Ensete ventricosum]|uniref:Uncharacterized protein n=1 Tax=Ensete ventricosum TaxID=4639 RepID=A0A426ZZX7_ENSVE|nr:hypothetical protein B296_00028548 [Ensete ventricosum]